MQQQAAGLVVATSTSSNLSRHGSSSVSPPSEVLVGERGSPVTSGSAAAGTVPSAGTINAVGVNGLASSTSSSSQCNGSNSATNMDNSMGQMGQMAPLGLSQSMDSVNTASNEEEVGQVSNYL